MEDQDKHQIRSRLRHSRREKLNACKCLLSARCARSAFEWNIGNETDWNNRVPIVRIRNVAKGLSHPALVKANKKSRAGKRVVIHEQIAVLLRSSQPAQTSGD